MHVPMTVVVFLKVHSKMFDLFFVGSLLSVLWSLVRFVLLASLLSNGVVFFLKAVFQHSLISGRVFD